MPENPQEQTEAKLLAYIEGELDESGRAEIERHIEANPKHRNLLDELAAGRRLLRLLPREVAPLDLYENVQSQFERQELLSSVSTLTDGLDGAPTGNGYDINPDTGNFRLSRWGRIRAAAAIALLAGGVGILAYNVVQPQFSRPVAVKGEPATADGEALEKSDTPSLERKLQSPADAEAVDRLRRLRMADAADHVRSLDEVRTALLGDTPDGAVAEAERLRRAAANRGAGVPGVAGAGAAPSDTSGHEPFYLVVASGDPGSARDEVLSILTEKGLTYSRVAVASPAKARSLQEIKSGGDDARQPKGEAAGSGEKAASERDAAPAPQASADKRAEKSMAPADAGGGAREAFAKDPSAPAATPATPSVPQATGEPSPQQKSQTEGTSNPTVEEVLIVRKVPRSRAAELVAAMNRPSSARYALAYGGDAARKAPAGAAAKAGMLKQSFGAAADASPGNAVAGGAPKNAASKDVRRPADALADRSTTPSNPVAPPPMQPAKPVSGAATEPRRSAPTTKPWSGEVASSAKPAEPPGVGQKGAVPASKPIAGTSVAEKGKSGIDAASRPAPAATAPPATPPIAASPAGPAMMGGATSDPAREAPAMPLPVAQSAAPAQAASGPAGGLQARQGGAIAPLAANDAIDLVYLDMRVSNRPVTQPMRISAKGTIYVAGIGEFALAGMSPAEAAEKLTAAMRVKTPTSRGVEIRRSNADGNAMAAQPPAPTAAPGTQGSVNRRLMDRADSEELPTGPVAGDAPTSPIPPPAPAPAPRPRALASPPAAKAAPPGGPAEQVEPFENDELVDLVIVLQRDVGGAEVAAPESPGR